MRDGRHLEEVILQRGYGELLDRPYNGLAVGERSGERLP